MKRSSLTRRGRVVVGVCVLGTVMALLVGARSLNAVVLPGVVALAAGYLQVSRVETPTVRRTGIADGFVEETREIRLEFYADSPGVPIPQPFIADVSDRLDDGLDGPEAPIRAVVGDESVTYGVRYLERGSKRIGPVRMDATDVFGLFTRRLVVGDRETTVVYPTCRPVPAWFRRGLYAETAVGASRQREEFDRLREYARGDSLRDVHWPATAKHDELVVKAFAAETEHRRVSITGGTAKGTGAAAADVLASAAASLAVSLLDDGVPVDLTLPSGTVTAEPGTTGRRRVLELAATTGPGGSVDSAERDVRIVANDDDARITAEGMTVAFSTLGRDGRDDETATDGKRNGRGHADIGGRSGSRGGTVATDGGCVDEHREHTPRSTPTRTDRSKGACEAGTVDIDGRGRRT